MMDLLLCVEIRMKLVVEQAFRFEDEFADISYRTAATATIG